MVLLISIKGMILQTIFLEIISTSSTVLRNIVLLKIRPEKFAVGRQLDGITDSNFSWSKFWEMVKNREANSAEVHGLPKSQTQLSN